MIGYTKLTNSKHIKLINASFGRDRRESDGLIGWFGFFNDCFLISCAYQYRAATFSVQHTETMHDKLDSRLNQNKKQQRFW